MTGDEAHLRDQVLAALRSRLVPGGDAAVAALATAGYSGAGAVLSEVLAAAAQVPWGVDRRLVVVRDPPWLGAPPRAGGERREGDDDASGEGQAPGGAAEAAALRRYLEAPPPHACVVILCEAVDRRRACSRLLYERATVVECRAPPERELPAWIARAAQRRGLALDPEAVRLLAVRVGRNLLRLERELDKLACHAPEGRVGVQAVQDLVPPAGEERVFALLDALAEGDRGGALALARRQLDAGDAPVALLALLGRHARRLLEAGLLLARGIPPAQVQERLGVHPYAARKLMAQARRYEPRGLARALAAVLEADEAVKTGRAPAELAVEMAVLALADAVRVPGGVAD